MTQQPGVLTGLTNVILGVRDMDRSLAFYRDALPAVPTQPFELPVDVLAKAA